MKRKTRNILVFLCLIITCCCFTFGSVSALAMIKNTPVASDVLTSENLFNASEWATDGQTAADTFGVVSYGKRTALYDYKNSHFGHIIPFQEITVQESVTFSIDVYGASELWFYLADASVENSDGNYWCPRNLGYDNDYACFYFQEKNGLMTYNEYKKPVYDNDTGAIVDWTSTVSSYYADKELTTSLAKPSFFAHFGVSYKVMYFTDSPVIYYSWTPIDRDGNYLTANKVEFYTKSLEGAIDVNKNYFAGIQISAVSDTIPSTFTNLSIKNGSTELVPNYSAENLDWCVNEIPESANGDVFVGHFYQKSNVKVFEEKEVVVSNAKNTDKMYAYEKLSYDENVDEQFKVSGKFQFRNDYDMNKAFGVALGLNAPSQDINSADTTVIGFENRMVAEDNAPLTQVKLTENSEGTGFIIPLKTITISQKVEASFDIKSFSRFIAYLSPATNTNIFTGNNSYFDAGEFKYQDGKLLYKRNNSDWLFKEGKVTIDGSNFTFGETTFPGGDNREILSDVSYGLNVKVVFYSDDYLTPTNEYSVIEYTLTPYTAEGELDTANALHVYTFGGGKIINSQKSFRIGLQVSSIDNANPVVLDNVVITNYTANGNQVLLNKTWDNMTSNIEDEDDSKVFVGFRTGGGVVLPSVSTHVVVYEGGVEKAAKSLGFNAVGLDYIDFTFIGYKDGSILANINGNKYELSMSKDNIDGYIAFAAKDNFDNMSVAVKNVEIRRYSYKETEEGEIGTNFNTGYFDKKEWMLKSTTSVKTKPEDQDKVKGLVMEDGKLKFAGTTDNSYFSTMKDYGDVILEFQIEEFFDGINPDKSDSDKPKMVDDWAKAHSYSACYVNFGVLTGNGVGTSCMIGILQKRADANSPFKGYINLSDYKSNVTVGKAIDYNFYPMESGASKTTAVKIIASRGTITMYVQEIKDGVAPSADKYVEVVSFDGITDLYGRIAFTSTEAGWFNIDNIRVYPIDDPVKKRVDAKIALFEDFKQIPDTPVPYQLDAPVVTLNENQISWNKVEGATGYRIRANGFIRDLRASQTSYDFNVNGDYEVVVIALGNGKEILDSNVSNKQIFTVGAKDSGSFFLIGGITLGVLAVVGAVTFIIIRKRRKRVVKGSE